MKYFALSQCREMFYNLVEIGFRRSPYPSLVSLVSAPLLNEVHAGRGALVGIPQ